MPLRPISGAICLAAVAELSAEKASARSQSGHRHAGVRPGSSGFDHSSASAQGNAAGASHADDASANLASGSSECRSQARGNSRAANPVIPSMRARLKPPGPRVADPFPMALDRIRLGSAGAEGQTGSSMGIAFEESRWWLLRRRAPQVASGRQAPPWVRSVAHGRVAVPVCSRARRVEQVGSGWARTAVWGRSREAPAALCRAHGSS